MYNSFGAMNVNVCVCFEFGKNWFMLMLFRNLPFNVLVLYNFV